MWCKRCLFGWYKKNENHHMYFLLCSWFALKCENNVKVNHIHFIYNADQTHCNELFPFIPWFSILPKQYLNEAKWNWRLMKTILTICHIYDKDQNYVAFDELAPEESQPITFLKRVMPNNAWFFDVPWWPHFSFNSFLYVILISFASNQDISVFPFPNS